MHPDYRVNLERASILLLDSNPLGLSILLHIFAGAGAKRILRCSSVRDAKQILQDTEIDLIVLSDELDDEPGYELIRWVRRLENNTNSFASAILVAGHIRRSIVQRTRDCGANFLMSRPLSPNKVLERVVWVSKEKRQFLETADYAGPDRRFHKPSESENLGRRVTDQSVRSEEAEAVIGGEPA